MHDQIATALAREPFEPFAILTADGRRIEVREANLAVLNSLAVSVVEAAFSITVVGLGQVVKIAPSPHRSATNVIQSVNKQS